MIKCEKILLLFECMLHDVFEEINLLFYFLLFKKNIHKKVFNKVKEISSIILAEGGIHHLLYKLLTA